MDIVFDVLQFVGVLFLVLMVFNLLIIVHEWGHFLAGRWRGLKIDRFQIWFGKPIWKKTINGVQYGLGTIPAGGFVSLPQMAPMEAIEGGVVGDPAEGEEEVEEEPLPPISPLDKIIVAFAGPLFSFLLAVAFAIVVWAIGKPVEEASITTVIGAVKKDSPADRAGLQLGDDIQAINGDKIVRFLGMNDSVTWRIVTAETPTLKIDLIRDGKPIQVEVERPRPKVEEVEGNWFKRFWVGLITRPELPKIGIGPKTTPVIKGVMENGPAEGLGLETGDVVKAIDGKPIFTFLQIDSYPFEAGKPVSLTILRDAKTLDDGETLVGGKTLEIEVTPRMPDEPDSYDDRPLEGIIYDYAGIRGVAKDFNPFTEVIGSFRSIVNTLRAVFSPKSDISAGHLSGPVGIMGLYYDLFQHENGWRLVLWFSILLNVNLAILNMLPFPVLDGGHIVMAAVEWIRKRPINLKLLEVVQTAFVLFLLGFMVFVTFKDVGDRVPDGEELPKAPRFLEKAET